MANPDAAFGLKPVRHYAGGTARPNGYNIAGGYATSIFTGDPVKSTGTGKNVEIGTAGGNILGVFWGCEYTDAQGREVFSNYWPASTAIRAGTKVKCSVYDDPNTVFEVQADEDIVEGDIANTADLISGTGDPATGTSRWELDSSTVGSGAQLKILELAPGIRNDQENAYGDFAVVNVLIAEHELRGATTAV